MSKISKDKNHRNLVRHGQALGGILLCELANYGISLDTLWAFRGKVFLIEIKNPEYHEKKKDRDRWNWLTKSDDPKKETEQAFAKRAALGKIPYHVVMYETELQQVFWGSMDYAVDPFCKKRARNNLLKQI